MWWIQWQLCSLDPIPFSRLSIPFFSPHLLKGRHKKEAYGGVKGNNSPFPSQASHSAPAPPHQIECEPFLAALAGVGEGVELGSKSQINCGIRYCGY